MMKNGNNENAISPILGTIFLALLVIILAAVVAAFVFGFADGMGKPMKVVGATAHKTAMDKIVVTYYGGKDAQFCKNIKWQVTSVNVPTQTRSDILNTDDENSALIVGSSKIIQGYAGQNHIVGTAYYTDGSQQVVLDAEI